MNWRLRTPPAIDLLAGLMMIGLGAFAAFEARTYDFGSLSRIGPGYFPVVLGLALIVFGLGIIIVEGARNPRDEPARPALRPMLAVVAAICAFGLGIERFGLAPAVFVSAFLAGLGEPQPRLASLLAVSTGLTIAAVAIFPHALGLPIRIVAW